MVDPRVQRCLKQFQIYCPDVDLSAPRRTSHGQFWYNLHIVLVHEGRYHQVNIEPLRSVHKMILATSAKKQHLLSRVDTKRPYPFDSRLSPGRVARRGCVVVHEQLGVRGRQSADLSIQLLCWNI